MGKVVQLLLLLLVAKGLLSRRLHPCQTSKLSIFYSSSVQIMSSPKGYPSMQMNGITKRPMMTAQRPAEELPVTLTPHHE
ncbi:hypothetical protein B566_EDAN016524, partial [Ephemera danica]